MADISNRLMGQFAQCLQSSLAGPGEAEAEAGTPAVSASASASPPAKPIKGLSLFFGVLWDRIKRLFGGGRAKS